MIQNSDSSETVRFSAPQSAPQPAPREDIEQRARIFAALSDPTRLRVVELLAQQGELSGSEIAAQVGISLALFCHHSKTLAEAGLLFIRKEGQTKYNSLNRELLLSCFAKFQGLCTAQQRTVNPL